MWEINENETRCVALVNAPSTTTPFLMRSLYRSLQLALLCAALTHAASGVGLGNCTVVRTALEFDRFLDGGFTPRDEPASVKGKLIEHLRAFREKVGAHERYVSGGWPAPKGLKAPTGGCCSSSALLSSAAV
jgi:hypothetical protein